MTIPTELTETAKLAVEVEKQRLMEIVLRYLRDSRTAGEYAIADVLDRLATEIEKS